MSIHDHNSNTDKKRAVANSLSGSQNSESYALPFSDNRPAAKQQRTLQWLMKNHQPFRTDSGNSVAMQQNVEKTVAPNVESNKYVSGEPPMQRLVVVPGGVDAEAKRIYESEHAVLNHIAWALDQSGGPLTDFREKNFGSLKTEKGRTATVHIVEHGAKGLIVAGGERNDQDKVQWYDTGTGRPITRDDFAAGKSYYEDDRHAEQEATGVEFKTATMDGDALAKNLHAALPKEFVGTIRITSCWSGVKEGDTQSLAETVAKKLYSLGREGLTVWGVMGPSVTGTGSFGVIKPEKERDAEKVKDSILKHNSIDIGKWYDWLDNNKGATLEEIAKESALQNKVFYEKFIKELSAQDFLYPKDKEEMKFETGKNYTTPLLLLLAGFIVGGIIWVNSYNKKI